jgi:hypothetical protein
MLVFAHGYDIALADERRLTSFLPGLRETAAAYGAKAVVIRTNLKRHPALRRVKWAMSHGGALAALGHLLDNHINRLVIPSSHSQHYEGPWGSHWELDPLWTSSSVAVEHSDASLARDDKVRALGDQEIAMRYLRVCWENNSAAGNCSRCEKCVRTMLVLWMCGSLQHCKTFDLSVPIDARLDALSVAPLHWISHYEELRRRISDKRVGSALDRLLARSRGYQGRLRRSAQWWTRALLRD